MVMGIAGRAATSRWRSRAMVSTWRSRSSLHTSVPRTEAANDLGLSVPSSLRAGSGALIVVFPSQWHLVGPRLLEWLLGRLSDGLAATFHCECSVGWPSCRPLFRFQQRDPSLLVLVTSGRMWSLQDVPTLCRQLMARCLPQLRFPEFGNKAGRPCSEPSGNTDGNVLACLWSFKSGAGGLCIWCS